MAKYGAGRPIGRSKTKIKRPGIGKSAPASPVLGSPAGSPRTTKTARVSTPRQGLKSGTSGPGGRSSISPTPTKGRTPRNTLSTTAPRSTPSMPSGAPAFSPGPSRLEHFPTLTPGPSPKAMPRTKSAAMSDNFQKGLRTRRGG